MIDMVFYNCWSLKVYIVIIKVIVIDVRNDVKIKEYIIYFGLFLIVFFIFFICVCVFCKKKKKMVK